MPFFFFVKSVPSHRPTLHQLCHTKQQQRRLKESLLSTYLPHLIPWIRPVYTQSPTMWHRGTVCTNVYERGSTSHAHIFILSVRNHLLCSHAHTLSLLFHKLHVLKRMCVSRKKEGRSFIAQGLADQLTAPPTSL